MYSNPRNGFPGDWIDTASEGVSLCHFFCCVPVQQKAPIKSGRRTEIQTPFLLMFVKLVDFVGFRGT